MRNWRKRKSNMQTKKGLDQFYTKEAVAKKCFRIAEKHMAEIGIQDPFYVEPSAGTGSFYNLMPEDRRLGLDLEPKAKGIIKADFLKYNGLLKIPKPTVVIGNPPFGRQNCVAVEFINLSASFAEIIGFIMPMSFDRVYYSVRLDSRLHLISKTELPAGSFVKDGKPYGVPCAFYIWSKQLGPYTDLRPRQLKQLEHVDFHSAYVQASLENYPEREYNLKPTYKGKPFAFGVIVSGFISSPMVGKKVFSLDEVREHDSHNHLLFFTDDQKVIDRLLNLDFSPTYKFINMGFTKGDIVEQYIEKYGEGVEQIKLF